MAFAKVPMHWSKRSIQTLQGLQDTGTEVTIPKYQCGPLKRIVAYESQVINNILHLHYLTVGIVDYSNPTCDYFPSSRIHDWDRFSNWKNHHIASLTYIVWAFIVGKAM
jgi:hypothetical protein